MSRHYKVLSRPSKWVSAHNPCEYIYSIPRVNLFGGYDAGGYLGLFLTQGFTVAAPQVGDRLFIYSGDYYGFHTITEVVSSIQFITSTEWTVSPVWNSEEVGFCYLPTIKIYKGYRIGELTLPTYPSGSVALSDLFPLSLVAEFSPEVSPDGLLRFDIYGYLKSVLPTPYKAGYNQDEESLEFRKAVAEKWVPANYMKVELIIENTIEMVLWVANTGLDTWDFNRYYVQTGQAMQPLDLPAEFSEANDRYYTESVTQTKTY